MFKKLFFMLAFVFSVSLFAGQTYTVEISYPSGIKAYNLSSLNEMFTTSFDRISNYQSKDGTWFCVVEIFSMGYDADNNKKIYLRLKPGMDTGKF